MKRYFINYRTDAITTETDENEIPWYFENGYTELTEEEYEREYTRIWNNIVNWRY